MSFTYEDFYLSGFNTGTTLSGIQKNTPLTWIVTGLKYNANPVTTGDFSWFTGVAVATSGTLTPQSGFIGFDVDNDEYRGALIFNAASGLTATGCIELYWNSGGAVQEGYSLVGQFDIFSNKSETAWNQVTNDDGSVDNADTQHSHAGAAQNLSDLDDVDLPGTITDNDVLVYSTESGAWTTGVGGGSSIDTTGYETVSGDYIVHEVDTNAHHDPTGYETISGDYITHAASTTSHHNPSGYESISGDYLITSGTVSDYIAVSGDYATLSGDYAAGGSIDPTGYETVSGDYILHEVDSNAHHDPTGYENVSGDYITHIIDSTAHHDPSGYETVSGDYLITSGTVDSYAAHIASTTSHHNPTGYETISGGYISHIESSTAHHNPSGYETISGDYLTTSGTIDDYIVVSGDYATTSGTVDGYAAHIASSTSHHNPTGYETVSGDYITHITDSTTHHDPSGYETISGDYLTTSGTIDDYIALSGDFSTLDTDYTITSGTVDSYAAHVASPTSHHNPSGYETISGAYITHAASSTSHHDPSGYETVSGDYLITSGTVDDYAALSGDYSTTSGTVSDHVAHKTSSDHDGQYYTETEINDRVFEKGSTFPGSPIEGDLHYDTVDEALYRYDGTALAWIQIGAVGVGSNTALTLEQARTNSNQIAGQIDMNQNLIIDLPPPTADTDVSNRKHARHGIASDDLVFSNDTERSSASPPMTKIKEITVYRSVKLRVYWQHKGEDAGLTICDSRVYVNGIAVGSLHENLTTSYVAFTEDIEVNDGDTVEIWARAFTDVPQTVWVRYQRLKFIEYVSTGGY